MFRRWSKIDGIRAWVTITGAILIVLSIIVIVFLESRIVDQAGAEDRQGGFLRAAEFVGNMIGKTGGIRALTVMEELIKEVRQLRPGIKRLSVFEITSESASLILSTDPRTAPRTLDLQELAEIHAGRSVMQLDDLSEERAWRITAPIIVDGKVIGALRGLYSIKEFDTLKQEIGLTKVVGLGVVVVTSLTFLLLVRYRIFGSVSARVATHSTVPTLILKGDACPVARVLLAVQDVEDATRLHRWLTAHPFKSPVRLTILTVISSLHMVSEHAAVEGDVVSKQSRQQAEQVVNDAAQIVSGPHFTVSTNVLVGDPVRMICEVGKNHDLIVVSSHGRKGLSRFLLGSVSEEVVNCADCSVLVLR